MIIWINGPFGGGKTHVAYELHRRLPNSTIFDPEEVGFFIRSKMIIEGDLPDFKDYSLWRYSTNYFLKNLDNDDRVIIVPMTLTNKEFYNEILEPLKERHKIVHITLLASEDVIKKRLLKRGDSKNSWTYKLVNDCLVELNDKFYDDRIFTDSLNIYEVVELIGKKYNLKLLTDNRNYLQKRVGKMLITFKNLRLKEMIFGY